MLRQRVQTFLFGDDIFISYSRADGATYAAGLGEALSRLGFSCKLDQWGTQPGKQIPAKLTQALRRSAMLVLVGTDGAARSTHVAEEVRAFRTTGRPIVPIVFGDPMMANEALWASDIEGLPISRDHPETLNTGEPSAPVVNRVAKTFTFNTKEKRLRRSAQVAAGVFVVLLAASIVLGGYASWKAAAAVKAAAEAERQQKIARLRAVSNRIDAELSRDPTLLERAVLVNMHVVKGFQALGVPSVEADRGLRGTLHQFPRLVARLPPLSGETTLSPDGEFFANGWGYVYSPVTVWGLATGEKVIEADHGPHHVNAVAFGLDAQRRTRYVATAGDDTFAGVWDLRTRKKVAWLKHAAPVRTVAFDREAGLLATSAADQIIHVWRTSDWQKVAELHPQLTATALAFGPQGGIFAAADDKGHVQIWKSTDGTWAIAGRLNAQAGISRLLFSPDGTRVLVLNEYGNVFARLYDWSKASLVGQLQDDVRMGQLSVGADPERFYLALRGNVRTLDWQSGNEGRLSTTAGAGGSFVSLDGRYFGILGNDIYLVRVQDTQNAKTVAIIAHPADRFPPGVITHVEAVHAAGRHVLTLVGEQYAVWENPESLPDRQYRHDQRVRWASLVAHGRLLGTASVDGMLKVWDTHSGAELFSFMTPNDPIIHPEIMAVAFQPQGDLIAIVNWHDIFVVQHSTGRVVAKLYFFYVYGLAFSPDGRYLAAGGDDGLVLWPTDSWRPIAVSREATGHVLRVVFSPRGTFVATITMQGERTTVWRTGTGKMVHDMTFDRGRAQTVAFSADEQLLAVSAAGGTWLDHGALRARNPTVSVRKVATGEEVLRLRHGPNAASAIVFSPDGMHLVTASGIVDESQADKVTVKVWRLSDGTEASSLDHEQSVSTIAFTADGQLMVTGGDSTTKVWDTRSWEQVEQLEAAEPLHFVSLSTGGRYAAAISTDRSAQVWSLDVSDLLASACERVNRELTPGEWRMYFGSEPHRAACAR